MSVRVCKFSSTFEPRLNSVTFRFHLKSYVIVISTNIVDIVIKMIFWEIYEYISEVLSLSHLGRFFGMIFRAQWAQKVTKQWKNMFDFLSPLSPKNHTKYPP